MKPRLIDANALLDSFKLADWYNNYDFSIIARPLTNHAPTIDAEPVIRCRECKYYDNHRSPSNDNLFPGYCRQFGCNTFPEAYCAFAVRTDEEN